jgi:hypothetical protein
MLSQTSILWINKHIWSEWLCNTIKIDFLPVIEISKEKNCRSLALIYLGQIPNNKSWLYDSLWGHGIGLNWDSK